MNDSVIGKKAHRFTPNEAPTKVDAQTRRFKLSDSSVALDGHTLATDGWDLSRAKDNLPVLWAHDAETVESVLGQWTNVHQEGDDLFGDAVFMPRDLNPVAGMVLDMIDGGWLRMCSVGFVPTDGKPSKRGPGTYDFTRQTLLEASICPVGSLSTALVSARDAGVDISPAKEWAKRIMEIDMPGSTEETQSGNTGASVQNSGTRSIPKLSKRGLYSVAGLAYMLQDLGYIVESAECEAECEGDNSPVPEMLLAALKQLGEALVAMTIEEVSELIGEEGQGDNDMTLGAMMMSADADTRATLADALRDAASGRSVTITTSRAVGRIHAGKAISKKNMDELKAAHEHMCHAVDKVKSLIDQGADESESEEETRAAEARSRRERLAKAAQEQVAE